MIRLWHFAWYCIYYVIKPIICIYFRLKKSDRARILVKNNQGQILLLKNSFGNHRWTLPGGGLAHHEKPSVGAARELHEEVGLRVSVDDLKEIYRTNYGFEDNLGYRSIIFSLKTENFTPKTPRRLEIMDIKWFDADDLPKKRADIVDLAQEKLH